MSVEFRLLGDLEVRLDDATVDIGHARQRCVLVALLVEANRVVPVDTLLNRVWGQQPPRQARSALRSYLSRLRQILAVAGVKITRSPGGYILKVDPMAVDSHRFACLIAAADAADDDQAEALYEQALGLWRGDPFATLDTPWLNSIRDALRRQRLAAILDRNDVALRRGQHGRLLAELFAYADSHPLDERLCGQLMLALYRGGRQGDALDTFRSMRLRLVDELGADPGPALCQLHQQILTGDPALALPTVKVARGSRRSTVPRQLPVAPRSFTGRTAELAELTKLVDAQSDQGAAVVISAIGGAGGIGKTWLVTRWANDNMDRFPDGQLYVNLRGFDPVLAPLDPAVAVRAFLAALGVDPVAIPMDPHASAALFRSLAADKRMLIVVDNTRDSAHATPLLPGAGTCVVLITSRHQLAGLVTGHAARPLPLDVLSHREANQLLTDRLGADRLAAEPEAVAKLLRWCGGLPLALGIIAARAALQPALPLTALADELQQASSRLDALDAGELTVNLRAVLACSYQALPAEAARMFGLLGLAPGPDISQPAAASLAALPLARARFLLRALAGIHLVQEQTPGRFRMHDLVRLYAAEQAHARHSDIELRSALHRVFDHYLHTAHAADRLIYPTRDPVTLPQPQVGVAPEHLADHDQALRWLGTERPVLLAAVAEAARGGFDTHTHQLAWTLATFLRRQGHQPDQIGVEQAALDGVRRQGDRSGQAVVHRRLAHAYIDLGRYEDAHAQLRHAFDLTDQPGNTIPRAHTHLDYAALLDRQCRYQEALDHDHRGLELYRIAGHQVGQARAHNMIAWHQTRLGDHQRSISSCQQALTLLQRVGDRAGEAGTWHSLGHAHHHLGHHAQAVTCYENALDLYREMGERYYEADTLSGLGDTHHAAGDPDQARIAWHRALIILDDLDHPDAEPVRVKVLALPSRS